MTRCSKMKILFCITIFFGLFNLIASNEDIFEKMSLDDRRSFFGTEDGSVPEYEIVEMVRPPRSKRSAKESIEIKFDDGGTLFTAKLYIVDDHDLISRGLTGIWGAQTNLSAYQNVSYTPIPDRFDDIGEFDLFQNVEDGSAVVRFRDSYGDENYVGLLKKKYSVKCLPKEFAYVFRDIYQKRIIGKRSVNSLNDRDEKSLFLAIFKNAEIPRDYFHRRSYAKNDDLPDSRLHRPRRQSTIPTKVPDVVYPKLLIIPDYGVILRYIFIDEILKHLIAQLNVVDMMFRQLKDPEVHINIAGIILPWDDNATPYIQQYVHNSRMRTDDALERTQLYFYNENRRFPHDEWDSIVILTTYVLFGFNDAWNIVPVAGMTQTGQGCHGGVAICQFVEGMPGMRIMAHELGHLFGVTHDEQDIAAKCKNDDGYAMVPNDDFFQKYEWSTCSRDAFQTFFRSDEGNCTYSRPEELPDVVRSKPAAWFSVAGHCDNLYNDSTNGCTEYPTSCIAYDCERNGTCDSIFNPGMEGVLMYDGGLKACINQTWVPV